MRDHRNLIDYQVSANAKDCQQAITNALSCLERGELDGSDYFLNLANHHLSRVRIVIRNRTR